jgi:hypothetical protein
MVNHAVCGFISRIVSIIQVFRSETDKLYLCVRELILSKKSRINHGLIRPHYRDMDQNDYSPFMVISTKMPIMIAMSNLPLHFLFLQSHLPLYLGCSACNMTPPVDAA